MKTTLMQLLIISISVVLFSCKGEEGKSGLPAPELKGSISGGVRGCFEAFIAGVKVKIIETSQSTMTDSVGNWIINDVNAGIYTIEFTKPGYGTSKISSFQFVGGGTASIEARTFLTKIPAGKPVNLEILNYPDGLATRGKCSIEFTPEIPADTTMNFRLYFSKHKNFNPLKGDYYLTMVPFFFPLEQPSSWNTFLLPQNLWAVLKTQSSSCKSMSPFVKGDTVYITVCASTSTTSVPQILGSGYYDVENFGQFVYTDVSTQSNTVFFILQ